MINEGDLLTNVELWKIKTTKELVKPNLKSSLRSFLLKNGLAHSFFKGFIWLCSVNGNKLENEMINKLSKEVFLRYGESSIENVSDLTNANVWHHLGVVLVRDALQYSLYSKFKNDERIIVMPYREIYKKEFITSGVLAGVIVGISFNRIFRIDGNVCICPTLVYDYCDSFYQKVKDPKERTKYISMVSKITSEEYEKRMNEFMKSILPLTIYLSDKKLFFNNWQYKLLKKGEISLERWLYGGKSFS
jgi:hypothetical protein